MNTKDVRALLDLFQFPLPKDADFSRDYSHLDVQIAIREAAISHLMNMTLQCLGAIRALVIESEVVRISHDSTDIDGSQRDSGNAQHLQRQVFAQAVQTMSSTIVVGRELDRQDPVKTLVESFPWKPNFLSNQWLMLQWQLMDLPPRDALLNEENSDHQTYMRLVKEVVRYYPQSLAEIDKFGQHYLYYVIQSQSVPLLRLFLRYHSKIIRLPDHHGKLPLHYVVTHSQHVEALYLICEKMGQSLAEVSQNLRDNYGNSLLHLASAGDSCEAIQQEILFAHPEGVKVPNNDQQYPLHFASATTTQVAKLQKLFTAFPEAITLPDRRGLFPLHQAALTNRKVEVAQYLHQCFPEAMKIPLVSCGRIPLHYATVKCTSTKLLRWMLEVYPASAKVMDENKRLPLHNLIARSDNVWSPLRVKCLRMLLDVYPDGASFRDKGGYTPLAIARRDGHGDLILRLLLRADPSQDPEALAEISYIAAQAKYKDMKRYDHDRTMGRTSSTRRGRNRRGASSKRREQDRDEDSQFGEHSSHGSDYGDDDYYEQESARTEGQESKEGEIKYQARTVKKSSRQEGKFDEGKDGSWILNDDEGDYSEGLSEDCDSFTEDSRRRSRKTRNRNERRPKKDQHQGSTIHSHRSYHSGYDSRRMDRDAESERRSWADQQSEDGTRDNRSFQTYSDYQDEDERDEGEYDDYEEEEENASAYEYRSVLSAASGSYSQRRNRRPGQLSRQSSRRSSSGGNSFRPSTNRGT